MGTHPANLVVRFLLELSALLIMGYWGWHRRDGGFQILVALAIPLVAAVLWGTFFAFAAWAIYDLRFARITVVFGTAVVLHYLLSYDRVRWLVGQ